MTLIFGILGMTLSLLLLFAPKVAQSISGVLNRSVDIVKSWELSTRTSEPIRRFMGIRFWWEPCGQRLGVRVVFFLFKIDAPIFSSLFRIPQPCGFPARSSLKPSPGSAKSAASWTSGRHRPYRRTAPIARDRPKGECPVRNPLVDRKSSAATHSLHSVFFAARISPVFWSAPYPAYPLSFPSSSVALNKSSWSLTGSRKSNME